MTNPSFSEITENVLLTEVRKQTNSPNYNSKFTLYGNEAGSFELEETFKNHDYTSNLY